MTIKSVFCFFILWLCSPVFSQDSVRVEVMQAFRKEKVTSRFATFHFTYGKPQHIKTYTTFLTSKQNTLHTHFDSTINYTRYVLHFPDSLRWYGGGEQFSYFLLNGKKLHLFSEEQGIGRGDKPLSFLTQLIGIKGKKHNTYYPLPYFLSSHYQLLSLDTCQNCYIRFRQKKNETLVIIDNNSHHTSLSLTRHHDYLSAIQSLAKVNGTTPLMPEWAYGTILGLQGGRKRVEAIVDSSIQAGVKVSAIWIQDWVGKKSTSFGSRLRWEWKYNPEFYPDFQGFVSNMHAKNVKVLGYINSFLLEGTEMCAEARNKGFVVKKKDGTDYPIKAGGFTAYLIDLSNPKACVWIKGIIKNNMIAEGLSGWMADFGEWLPFDAVLASGVTADVFHNQYPVMWAKVNKEAIEEANKAGEILFFMRAGYQFTQKYSPMMWVGDQTPNFGKNDGLPSALNALLSSSFSGVQLNHADIGGYTSIQLPFFRINRNRDLLYRWTEMAVFTPFFRTHEGLHPDKDLQFYSDAAALHFFSEMSQVHEKLFPYLLTTVTTAHQKGIPAIRPVVGHFPHDANTYNIRDAFFLGDSLLISPIIKPHSFQKSVYLPEGQWQHFFTGKVYNGNATYLIAAPYGQPPAFWKIQ